MIDHVLHLVDEFGRAMNDNGRNPGGIDPAKLNRQREELHDAIRALARGEAAQVIAAQQETASVIAAAARPHQPAPLTGNLTTDPTDPRLTRGTDDAPAPQADAYLVLSVEERAKGFVRPYRDAYRHDTCGTVTTMGRALSETYARDPKFYGGTYCVKCQMHRPVGEFHWYEMDGAIGPVVGS